MIKRAAKQTHLSDNNLFPNDKKNAHEMSTAYEAHRRRQDERVIGLLID